MGDLRLLTAKLHTCSLHHSLGGVSLGKELWFNTFWYAVIERVKIVCRGSKSGLCPAAEHDIRNIISTESRICIFVVPNIASFSLLVGVCVRKFVVKFWSFPEAMILSSWF